MIYIVKKFVNYGHDCRYLIFLSLDETPPAIMNNVHVERNKIAKH